MGFTAVFGTVFVDIKGFPFHKYVPAGRNVGEVKIVHGGVSRNVAENLVNVGCDVSFITMFEEGGIGDEVRRSLMNMGVDLQYAVTAPNGMGMWLAVMDENGDLAGSISRQPDFFSMEELVDRCGDAIVSACENVVLEIDMNAAIAEKVLRLAHRYGKDVFVVVGNMAVILDHPEYLRGVRLFILNEIEAGRLSGRPLERSDISGALEIARAEAQRRGIREIVITLGDQGAVYFDSLSGESGHIPAEQASLVDSTGAGDAFFSGAVAARIYGFSLKHAAEKGAHLAALTIQTDQSTCPVMADFLKN